RDYKVTGVQTCALPISALAGAAAAAPAGALVVAGAQPGPGGQVPGGREAAHVDPDLGHDRLGGPLADAGDGVQSPDRVLKRALRSEERRVGKGWRARGA